jgi:hypothetical protein
LAARARTRLFGLIAMQNRALRAHPPCPSQLRCFSFEPQKYMKFIELGPPTSKAFFFPLDYMQTEEAMKYEVPFFLFDILFFFFSPFYFLLIPLFLSFSLISILFFVFLFFSSYILNCFLYYRHNASVILSGFPRGPSLF